MKLPNNTKFSIIKPKYFFFPYLFVLLILIVNIAYAKTCKIVKINGVTIKAEIASTPREKARGLMFREKLAGDEGMLFIYQKEGIYQFWMKNTKIPLDIIWIDKDKKIVFIKKDARPCATSCELFSSGINSKYVLEVNSGFSEKNGLKIGDIAEFN